MRKIFLIPAFFIVSFLPPHTSKNFTVQQLAPHVWAAIQNDKGGHAICNAGIVDLGDKTLVFDAFINVDAATELRQIAEELTKHPVTYLVNSHYHDDHIRGNQAFMPGATIKSTEWTKTEMQKAEPEEQAWARKNIANSLQKAKKQQDAATGKAKEEAMLWTGYYEAISQSLPGLKSFFPSLTFKDSLWIHGSATEVLLIECSGHTLSDAVMILPHEGIAFMGDLLFVDRHPYLGDGDPESWKKNLEKFYNDNELKTFVPGHGPVAGKRSLQTIITYITDLQQLASDAVKKGETDSAFAKSAVLQKYKDWWYGRFYPANLGFVYEKAKSK
jgi:glyoxylase-like metal-dependent hydrolase (beta-lactamase superfamily II)